MYLNDEMQRSVCDMNRAAVAFLCVCYFVVSLFGYIMIVLDDILVLHCLKL